MGYGLTFGVDSRVDITLQCAQSRIHAGNAYVNRNMIGAVVGVHPGFQAPDPRPAGRTALPAALPSSVASVSTLRQGRQCVADVAVGGCAADAVMIEPELQTYSYVLRQSNIYFWRDDWSDTIKYNCIVDVTFHVVLRAAT